MGERFNGDIVSSKAARSYREEQVNGLSQKQLILMLYDGAINLVKEAETSIERKDYPRTHKSLVKAREIVAELLRILNMEQGGEVAKNLSRLYVYVIGRLIEVNFTKETALLANVINILEKLRSAWAELDFEKAMAEIASDNGQPIENHRGSRSAGTGNPAENSRLISLTA